MPTEQDPEEFIEEDEQDEIARRSIFSAGWFRALLVLTVLAIVVVVSLPYLLNWLEPTPTPPAKPQAKVSEPATPQGTAPVPAPAPSDAKPQAPAMVPAPTTPTQPSKAEAPGSPPAKTDQPKAAQAPAPPSPADRPVGTAPLPAVPAPATPPAKAAPAAKPETPKAASATRGPAAAEGGSQGGYWIQVGAFVEEHNAESLARQLKAANFPVAISRVSRGGGGGAPAAAPAIPAAGGQNQLFITSSTPDAVNAALKGKGTAQAVKGGVVVNPPYDLETAMSLSSSLKKEGFKVVIRRAKAAPAAAPSAGGGGRIFHVVRVGGYPDRAKAQQARGELESKGHSGFLMQGAAR
jgi:SPOR domain